MISLEGKYLHSLTYNIHEESPVFMMLAILSNFSITLDPKYVLEY